MKRHRLNLIFLAVSIAIIFVFAFVLFLPSLTVPFLFDDLLFISSENSGSWGLEAFLKDAGIFKSRPVLGLCYAMNYEVSGNSPSGFHIGNILIHAFNCLLIFLILKKLIKSMGGDGDDAKTLFLPLGGALLFLVHPLATESVVYVTGRSSLLYTMFLLLSLFLFIDLQGREGFSKGFVYFLSLLSFTAALAGKEIALLYPLILFVIVFSFSKIFTAKKQLLYTVPFLLISVLLVVFKMPSLFLAGSPDKTSRGIAVHVMTEMYVFAESMGKILFPVSLNFDPDYSDITSPLNVRFLGGILFFILIIAGAIYLMGKNAFLASSLLWFAVSFLPHFFIRLRDYMSERWLYFPLISAAFLSAGIFLGKPSGNPVNRKSGYISVVVFFVIISVFSALTYNRLEVWQSAESIWRDTVKKSPGKFRVHANLGHILLREKKFNEAKIEIQKAMDINSEYAEIHYDMAQIYINTGNETNALAEYQQTLRYMPYYDDPSGSIYYNSMINIGVILFKQGNKETALDVFSNAVKINSSFPQAFNNLGIVFMSMGDEEKAELNFLLAINRDDRYNMAYYNLANLYERQGRKDEADALLRNAGLLK